MNYLQHSNTQNLGELGELGNWFKKAASNVVKFAQQTSLVSHAAYELGVGKTKVGKILVPTSSTNWDKYQTIVKSDIPKPVLTTVDATNCARPEFMKDPRCVEFMNAQAQVETSEEIIATTEAKISNKTIFIVGSSVIAAGVIIYLASTKKSKH